MNQLPQHLIAQLRAVHYTTEGIKWLIENEMSVSELATGITDKATAGWSAYCNRRAAGEPPPDSPDVNDLFK